MNINNLKQAQQVCFQQNLQLNVRFWHRVTEEVCFWGISLLQRDLSPAPKRSFETFQRCIAVPWETGCSERISAQRATQGPLAGQGGLARRYVLLKPQLHFEVLQERNCDPPSQKVSPLWDPLSSPLLGQYPCDDKDKCMINKWNKRFVFSYGSE